MIMFLGLSLAQWGVIAPIVLSVVAIFVALWSSAQSSKQTRQQIGSIKKLSQLQIEATLLLIEEELFNTITEQKKVELQVDEGARTQSQNITCVGAMTDSIKAYKQQYSPILQGYQARIDKLTRVMNQLKSKKEN